ncbi:hypothetical protein [Haloarcula amylovorans]|uniref:hypothetical protein n=1 Tax=Haloarcula amylovorans TaxID=2562280 RepID=UPI0010769AA4|nr:hypothetical protein [Halomicroarcula amylolytica]
MSQATDTPRASPLPRNPARSGEVALEWFETLVWHDHEVCSECFSRLRRSDTVERDDWGREDTASWRTPSAVQGEELIDSPATIANAAPKAVPRTTCGECGSVRGLSQSDTLSKRDALDRVPALVERLQEAGYFVDVQRVYDVVAHLKSHPDHEADDKRIFAVAAAKGVQHR